MTAVQPQHGAGLPRPVEILTASLGLLLLSPVLAVTAIAVKLSSPGPVLFRQQRVGRDGRPFTLYKFRTMHAGQSGPAITTAADHRITRIGRMLRKSKLDELPELINIVKGDMAFVGPRPEVPRFVDLSDPLWRETLRVRPGLTDPVSLALCDEEDLLLVDSADAEESYIRELLPAKLGGQVAYLRRRTWRSDFAVMLKTVCHVWGDGRRRQPQDIERVDATRRLSDVTIGRRSGK